MVRYIQFHSIDTSPFTMHDALIHEPDLTRRPSVFCVDIEKAGL